MNDIELTGPFTARWVMCYDKNNNRIFDEDWHLTYGDDIEVDSWEELAQMAEEDPRGDEVCGLEFQTYDVDKDGECIDSTIEDYRIDWMEGMRRLMKFVGYADVS